MSCLSFILKSVGLKKYSDEDVAEAKTEDALRSIGKAVDRLTQSTAVFNESNARLRDALRRRTHAFADLETSMQGDREFANGNR